jgi:hypothetical protein
VGTAAIRRWPAKPPLLTLLPAECWGRIPRRHCLHGVCGRTTAGGRSNYPDYDPSMGKVLAALVALFVSAGCSSPSATDTEPGATATTSAVAAAAPEPSPTTRPSSPLTSDGFGATPPTSEKLREFGRWMDGPGQGAEAATDAAAKGFARMNQANNAGDIAGFSNACPGVTNPLTIRLPASLPTPDPDLTNALQFLVDDGKALKTACEAFDKAPTEGHLDAVTEAIQQLGADMTTAGEIIIRNGDLLLSEAERLDRGGR